MKKSQSLSLTTVVVAVLALFVLVVMIIIFANKAKPVSEFYADCESRNGTLAALTEDCSEKTNGQKPISSPFVRGEKQKCCVSAGGLT